MRNKFFDNLFAGTASIVLHIVLLGLFVVGMESQTAPHFIAKPPQVEIVQAKAMDESQILDEIARQQELEDKQHKQEQERQAKLDQKLEETQKELARKEQEFLDQQERAKIEQQQRDLKAKQEQERIKKLEQERKLEDQKREQAEAARKLAEQQKKQAEQERLAAEELQQKADQKRREAEEKQRLAEADRKAEEARKKQAEADRKAAEEKKRKAEAERKAEEARKKKAQADAQRAEADRLLQESLAAEQREQDERRVNGVVNQYVVMIRQKVKRNWIRPANTTEGLQCTLRVTLMPGGDVKQVKIVKTSGNGLFDRSAESAVFKAAPLPLPTDPKAAAALKDFQFIFRPE